MDTASEIAPDGSPVAVYLALPAEPEFTPVLDALPADATVLDLGCGVGRLANRLAERGNRVTGVDESAAMLAHLHPAVEAVEARVEDLDLDRRFDAVVLASHLVNVGDRALRHAWLRCAARHAGPAGQVLVEHYDPERTRASERSSGEAGPVRVDFRVLERRGDQFDGRVVFRLGEASWEQRFTAEILDDGRLDAALAGAGLRRARRLSPTWLVAARAA